ncbi:DUF4232 domain-containing protein [Streptomyces sp. RerS4]|uniref:DUF4232 domain-containing protein n=1 Tax=Streptomyces sp. RerS4 TaxID=2942449 RepID=UPI00201C5AF7|nr:DUF4232 domain-containing protein [Streptomyces sp. RerS4]UQW99401.1 DUF4232 domain-containing protein [Streptomyces sp. RerS4]
MHIHRSRAAALATIVGLAVTLTACEGTDGTAAALKSPTASPTPGTSAASTSPTPAADQSGSPTASTGTDTPATAGPTQAGPDNKGTSGGTDGATTADAYAYTHPCSARNITVKVTSPQGFPAGIRVITVTNNGSTTCGLDFVPLVGFSSKGEALGIQATTPDGVGGAPAHPVRPGATTYAALDLNPSGGSGPVADEIQIVADPSHMPLADSVRLPLTAPGTVVRPKVGIFHFTARDSLNTL